MLVPQSLVSIGTIHFASALCWWLVAVVGELTSSFLMIPFCRKAAEGEKGGRVSDVGGSSRGHPPWLRLFNPQNAFVR
jgi:hypothetical protein